AVRSRRYFFCSGRTRYTRFSRDWSSDVCSSDLLEVTRGSPHAAVVFSRMRMRRPTGHLEVRRLNDVLKRRIVELRRAISSPKEHKRAVKDLARASKARHDKNLFVLDFKGDVMASAAESLREEVTAVLGVAADHDEVMVRIESAGGAVHGYGFAASQLARIRRRGLKLTACVDRVAASGGYL